MHHISGIALITFIIGFTKSVFNKGLEKNIYNIVRNVMEKLLSFKHKKSHYFIFTGNAGTPQLFQSFTSLIIYLLY